MTLRQYLYAMLLGTAAAWVSFGLVLRNLNPDEGGWAAIAMFYATLGVALVGSAALVGLGLRRFGSPEEPVFRQVALSFRQGLMVALIAIIALILRHENLLAWWSFAILLIAMTLLELFLLSLRRKPSVPALQSPQR